MQYQATLVRQHSYIRGYDSCCEITARKDPYQGSVYLGAEDFMQVGKAGQNRASVGSREIYAAARIG